MVKFPIWVGYVFERFPILSNLYLVSYGKEETSKVTQYAIFSLRKKQTGTHPHLRAILGALLHDIVNPLRIVDALIETFRRFISFIFSPLHNWYLRIYSVKDFSEADNEFLFPLRRKEFPPIFDEEARPTLNYYLNRFIKVPAFPVLIVATLISLIDLAAAIYAAFFSRLYLAVPYVYLSTMFENYTRTPILEPNGIPLFQGFYKNNQIEAGDSEKNQVQASWFTQDLISRSAQQRHDFYQAQKAEYDIALSLYESSRDSTDRRALKYSYPRKPPVMDSLSWRIEERKQTLELFQQEASTGKVTHKPGLLYFFADLPYQMLKMALREKPQVLEPENVASEAPKPN